MRESPSERYILTFITLSYSAIRSPFPISVILHISLSARLIIHHMYVISIGGPVQFAPFPRPSSRGISIMHVGLFNDVTRRRYEVERGRYEYLNAPQGENIRGYQGGRAVPCRFIDHGASRR